ncbi:MAG: translation initiation factor IF-3 [Patescibacteria group bacterium]
MNDAIRAPEVRVQDNQGEQLGIMPIAEALRIAQEQGFDLIEIAPQAQPPVVRIADYGAWKFRQEKMERKQKAHQKKSEVKGIRLSFTIGEHDLEVRRSQALKFLEQGDKVKPEIILRGRQIIHQDKARGYLIAFAKDLGEGVFIEQPISRQGKKFFMVIAKKK